MSWRPSKDWLYGEGYQDEVNGEYKDNFITDAFEAGADALLRVLKKEAIHIRTVTGWKYLKDSYKEWLHGDEVGYIAFIPDEKEED